MSPPTRCCSRRLKHLTFKNRVMSTAHAPNYVEDGLPRQRYQLYHEEKAKGGLALTMFGGASSIRRQPGLVRPDRSWSRPVVPVLQEFSERIHAHGCALMVQMTHAGRRTRWDTGDWLPTVSASPLREHQHRSFPKELEVEDIRRIHKAFAAAALAGEGGRDRRVEIACSTHLPHQFWSPAMNRRTDGYGGSLANRIRFTLEMFAAIREAVGADYVVGIRMSGDEMLEGGLAPEESLEIAVRHAESGMIDFLNVIGADASTDLGISKLIPTMGQRTAPYVEHARLQAGDRPAGVPRHPHHRPQHGPPRHRRGLRRHGRHDPRPHRRPASDGQGDARRGGPDPALRGRRLLHRPDLCRRRGPVHPQPGHRARATMPHAIARGDGPRRRVVVIGGGPAGLEAARVSAARGHDVVLWRRPTGWAGRSTSPPASTGAARSWASPAGCSARSSSPASTSVQQLRRERGRAGAHTGRRRRDRRHAQCRLLRRGCDLVASGWDVLSGQTALTGEVLVYDENGQHQGPSVAEFLAARGAKVTFVVPDRMPAVELGPPTRRSS